MVEKDKFKGKKKCNFCGKLTKKQINPNYIIVPFNQKKIALYVCDKKCAEKLILRDFNIIVRGEIKELIKKIYREGDLNGNETAEIN